MYKTYTKEDFDEDCPRFIPMKYESEIYENGESVSWYIFDTEKLDFIGGIVPYYDYQEAEKVCNIFNGVSYIFKGDVKLEGKESLLELAEYVDKLQDDNEQLKQGLNDDLELIGQLQEENEQLKKENYELHKRLGDFESFEEHIKERTSKTSVNDIVGLVKTNEPTDIVELKRD